MTDLKPNLPPPSRELRRDRRLIALAILALAALGAFLVYRYHPFRGPTELLHVSYDASREFYRSLNAAYLAEAGEGSPTKVTMSHAGSVRQARSLLHGHVADVISLASDYDLDTALESNGCIASDWRQELPHQSSPFFSTIAIVTRKGNPKEIRDWSDLWRRDLVLALPNPSRSGAGRWAFLALYAEARARMTDEASARRHLQSLALRCELLEGGARQSLLLFANASRADAYLTWESDALRLGELGHGELESVFLERSILAEPRLAVATCHAHRRDTRELAQDYLHYHYSPAAQAIATRFGLRPRDQRAARDAGFDFPSTRLFTIDSAFADRPGIWDELYGEQGFFPYLEDLRFARRGGRE